MVGVGGRISRKSTCKYLTLHRLRSLNHSGTRTNATSDNKILGQHRSSGPKPSHIIIILLIMNFFKGPTLWLKVLSKHGVTHMMYIEVEMLSAVKMYVRKKERRANISCRQGFKRSINIQFL